MPTYKRKDGGIGSTLVVYGLQTLKPNFDYMSHPAYGNLQDPMLVGLCIFFGLISKTTRNRSLSRSVLFVSL